MARQMPCGAIGLGLVLLLGADARADFVTITPLGTPGFELTDFHLFTAPVGTAADGYAAFFGLLPKILPAPYYTYNASQGLVVPGAPHAGPYNQDLAQGLAHLGISDSTAFHPADISSPNGIYLAYMLVPGPKAPTGSSSDSANGPILPNSLFPITVAGTGLYRNGDLFDPGFGSGQLPGTSLFGPPYAGLDGWSHFPVASATNLDFAQPGQVAAGRYTYGFDVLDSAGNGYHVEGAFVVAPEPGTLALCGLGLACLLGYAGRRRLRT